MRHPIITDAAQADLDEAWGFLARKSLKAADALIDRFMQKALVHAEFPESGRPREDLGPGLRSFVVTPYVAFFRQAGTTIEILRVLHGRRDIERIMRED